MAYPVTADDHPFPGPTYGNIVHMLNDTNYNVTPVFPASVLTLLPYLSLTTLLLFKHTQSS